MTQIALGAAGDAGVLLESKEPVGCKWKKCRENHVNKPSYPNDGVLSYNSTYKDDWVSAGKEPWILYGDGIDTKGNYAEYKNETPNANYLTNAASMVHPQYHTQKHHLIPVKSLDAFSILKHDAKLIGYDINHSNNGVCLPTYTLDIARHDLHRHRGRHSMKTYKAEVANLLRSVEKRCKNYCVLDVNGEIQQQKRLIEELDRQSARIHSLVKNWRLLLSSNALVYRNQSNARLAG